MGLGSLGFRELILGFREFIPGPPATAQLPFNRAIMVLNSGYFLGTVEGSWGVLGGSGV